MDARTFHDIKAPRPLWEKMRVQILKTHRAGASVGSRLGDAGGQEGLPEMESWPERQDVPAKERLPHKGQEEGGGLSRAAECSRPFVFHSVVQLFETRSKGRGSTADLLRYLRCVRMFLPRRRGPQRHLGLM